MSAGRTLSSDWSVVLKWLSMNNAIFFKFSQNCLSKAEITHKQYLQNYLWTSQNWVLFLQGVGMAVKCNVE